MTYTRKDLRIPVTGMRTPPMSPARPRFAGLSRSAVTLFRLGTYRTRLAAALMIVATSLLYQTGAEALEQSSKKVLYLDAPSVTVPEAEQAGTMARGHAGPDSSVDDAVLAWVNVQPVPGEARDAFASITAPGGQPPGGVSYDDAVAAGDAMVAQIGGEPPVSDGGGDEELASAKPVRPTLGDGTKATDAPDPQAGPQSAQPANPANPSDLGLPAPMAQAYTPPKPPANNKKSETPSKSSGNELAAIPDAPAPEMKARSKPLDTGPIADDYRQKPTATNPSERVTEGPTHNDPPGDDRAAVSKDTKEEPSTSKAPDAIEQKASPIVVVPDSSDADNNSKPEYAAAQQPSDNQATSQPAPDPTDEPRQSSSPEQEAPSEQEARPSTQEPSVSSDLVAVVPASTETNEGQQEDPAAQPRAATPDESSGKTSTGAPGGETDSPAPDTGYRPDPASQTEPTPDAESPENKPSPANSASPPQTPEDSAPTSELTDTKILPAESSEDFPSDSGNSETTEQQISIVVQDNASEVNTSTPAEQQPPTDAPKQKQIPADRPSDKAKNPRNTDDDSSEKSKSSELAPEEPSDAPTGVSEVPPQEPDDASGDEPAAAPEQTAPAGGSQRSAPNRTAQPPRKGGETRQRTTPRPSERSSPKPGGSAGSNRRGPTQTPGAVQISSQSPAAEAPEIAQDTGTTTGGLQDDSSAAPPTQRQPAAGSARSAPRAVQRADARAQRRAARQAARRVAPTPTPATPTSTPTGAVSDAPIVEPATAVHQAARKQRRAQRIANQPPVVSPRAAANPDATPAEPGNPAHVQEPTANHYSEEPPVAAPQASDLAAEIDSATQETVAAVEAEPTPEPKPAGTNEDPYPEPTPSAPTRVSQTSVEEVTADVAPTTEPIVEQTVVSEATAPDAAQPDVTPSDSYAEPQAPAAEPRLEPVAQVPAQRLEPVQQVPSMPLDTTPPPATAAPEPAAPEPAAAPEAVQEIQSTVETAVSDPAGGNQ